MGLARVSRAWAPILPCVRLSWGIYFEVFLLPATMPKPPPFRPNANLGSDSNLGTHQGGRGGPGRDSIFGDASSSDRLGLWCDYGFIVHLRVRGAAACGFFCGCCYVARGARGC